MIRRNDTDHFSQRHRNSMDSFSHLNCPSIRRLRLVALAICGVVCPLILPSGSAQVPNTLQRSFVSPGTAPQAGVLQGWSVAIEGTFAIAGGWPDDNGGENAGAVKVYHALTGQLLHTLRNPDPVTSGYFGYSVGVSNSMLVVGAYTNGAATTPGTAYVYNLAGATPTVPIFTLNNPSPAAGDGFGWSVAISGMRIVVGAHQDDASAFNAGSAYVYDLASATPTVPVATLPNPTPASGDNFGIAVAISGTRVVVGARFDDTGAGDAGSAYVYDLTSATAAVPIRTLNNPTPAAGENFGRTVGIFGARVVVGAPYSITGGFSAGSVYAFDLGSATPTVPTTTIHNPSPAADDRFGLAIALAGTRVAVGANLDDAGATDAGMAYVYDLASATPTVAIANLPNPTPAASDNFGSSVAISGPQVVVGAPFDDTMAGNAGGAYVYDLSSGTPTVPTAILNTPSPQALDRFGSAVAVSGTRVVVGSPLDDTGAENAGSAFVFDLASATPNVSTATLVDPSAASNDNFGTAVAISGSRVVVGAPFDNTGASGAGSAYVYDSALQPAVTDDGGYLTIAINKQAGVTYEVQSAGTLFSGMSASFNSTTTTVVLDNGTTLRVRDSVPIGTSSSRFLRVKVIAAP